MKHRKEHKEGETYNPYAGPYDITLVKLNKFVDFEEGKVITTNPMYYIYVGTTITSWLKSY